MKDGEIYYDSNEISNMNTKLNEIIDMLQLDIKTSLNKDFILLQDLELYDEGLKNLKNHIDKSVQCNNSLISGLKSHDINMNDLEANHLSLLDQISSYNNDSGNLEYYSGSDVTVESITVNHVSDGKVVLNNYVKEVLPTFSYDKKLEILKSILNTQEDALSILTDSNQSDILIYELKNILEKKYNIVLDKMSLEEEKEIQKEFFESIIDNDTNIFDEIDEKSYLDALPYFKQIASKNGISATDLIFDEKNNELFTNTIKELYESDNIDVLSDEQLESFKTYINKKAADNRLAISRLISDPSFSNVVKGGIYDEG